MALLTGELRFERWVPIAAEVTFSGAADYWTRAFLGSLELTNWLEGMIWTDPYVECLTCPECANCGPARLARVASVGASVVWQAPLATDVPNYGCYGTWEEFCRAGLVFADSVVFSSQQWEAVRQQSRSIPRVECLPSLRRGDLQQLQVATDTHRLSLKQLATQFAADLPLRIIAADPLDLDTTEQQFRELEAWFAEDPLAEVHGRLELLTETKAVVQRVYLDPPQPECVPLFEVGEPRNVVLGPWILRLYQ